MWTLPKFRMFRIFLNINSISYSFRSIATKMVLDIQTVHHILKNTAVQNVNKPFVYIRTWLPCTLTCLCLYSTAILYKFAGPNFGVFESLHKEKHINSTRKRVQSATQPIFDRKPAQFFENATVPFLRNFHWGGGGGGGQNRKKRQNEKYEPSKFGERASLKRDFVKTLKYQ
jgi:hypothetical protein